MPRVRPSVVLLGALVWATGSPAYGARGPSYGPPTAIPGAATANAISVRAAKDTVTWIDRLGGQVLRRSPRLDHLTVVARVPVATDGEQRGLLGYAVVGRTQYVAFTRLPDRKLVVMELSSEGVPIAVTWEGTSTASKAIGGHLDVRNGKLVLGLGELTGWAKTHGSGAIVTIDPHGPPTQKPVVLTDGWHNPFAFAISPAGEIWVADNAPEGKRERIGRGDVRAKSAELPLPQRALSAIAVLTGGRVVVCGYLDGEARVYLLGKTSEDEAPIKGVERVASGCLTGLAVEPNGSLLLAGPNGLTEAARL